MNRATSVVEIVYFTLLSLLVSDQTQFFAISECIRTSLLVISTTTTAKKKQPQK